MEIKDLANTMFAELSRYKKLKDSRFEEITKKNNLRRIDVEILFYLDCCGENDTARDIAATNRFTKGHISQSTKRLSEMGYIVSKKDEADMRVLHLSLTEKAKSIIGATYQVRSETFRTAFKGVSDEEIETVKKVCEIVCENISNEFNSQ